MRICIYMVKVISLSNEAYQALSGIKGKDSFSKVVLRLVGRKEKKPLSYFAGKWKGDTKIFDEILASRAKFKLRKVEF